MTQWKCITTLSNLLVWLSHSNVVRVGTAVLLFLRSTLGCYEMCRTSYYQRSSNANKKCLLCGGTQSAIKGENEKTHLSGRSTSIVRSFVSWWFAESVGNPLEDSALFFAIFVIVFQVVFLIFWIWTSSRFGSDFRCFLWSNTRWLTKTGSILKVEKNTVVISPQRTVQKTMISEYLMLRNITFDCG